MPLIVFPIEDKVRMDLLAALKRLVFDHVFVGVALMLLFYFQLDAVIPEIVAALIVYTCSIIMITFSRHLMCKFSSC